MKAELEVIQVEDANWRGPKSSQTVQTFQDGT
jgi:hypothetical protein